MEALIALAVDDAQAVLTFPDVTVDEIVDALARTASSSRHRVVLRVALEAAVHRNIQTNPLRVGLRVALTVAGARGTEELAWTKTVLMRTVPRPGEHLFDDPLPFVVTKVTHSTYQGVGLTVDSQVEVDPAFVESGEDLQTTLSRCGWERWTGG